MINIIRTYFRSAGAIFLARVPATIITLACRGLGLKMMPYLSRSYLEAPACIISTAHQASPKVTVHMDPVRAQFMSESTFDIAYSATLFKPVLTGRGVELLWFGGADEWNWGWEEDMCDKGVVWSKVELWDESKASFEAVCHGIRAAIWSLNQLKRELIFFIRERTWGFGRESFKIFIVEG